nr:hypothetical protein [uncultured Duganella sp.]
MEQTRIKAYDGPALSMTVSREGNRIHRLVDDTNYPVRPSAVVVRRDPMVAALFGAAPIQFARAAPAMVKKTRPGR